MEILAPIFSQIIRAKQTLAANDRISRALQAANSQSYFGDIYQHERMLADAVRLDAYHAAIERYVGPADRVLDVGTGTGVLAFFAAARSPQKVYALDHSKSMLAYAESAAKMNGIQNVTFVASNSRNFSPEALVDVIVQEQIGSHLFQEGMVDTILDLRDRCLKPGGRILPAKFEFYLEPVELIESMRIPFIQNHKVRGIQFPESGTLHKPAYYYRNMEPAHFSHQLCDPEPVFSFDLTTLTRDGIPRRFHIRKRIAHPGRLDGICMYFKASFDDDISFSTAPTAPKTHWNIPLYRMPGRVYDAGEPLEMNVDVPKLADHLTWTWKTLT
ncbi:MAG: methyltransferase domain-containing protein [Planctomycetes bacterium]|nr:methyltransferase domain-containing protein [Planctomycetota bacterium]